MEFWHSLAHRSPHRLSVAYAASIQSSMRATLRTRSVGGASGSPTRNTVWPESRPTAPPRVTWAGSHSATSMLDAMTPISRPSPTIPAITGSFQQFCSEAKNPSGLTCRLMKCVAHSVS